MILDLLWEGLTTHRGPSRSYPSQHMTQTHQNELKLQARKLRQISEHGTITLLHLCYFPLKVGENVLRFPLRDRCKDAERYQWNNNRSQKDTVIMPITCKRSSVQWSAGKKNLNFQTLTLLQKIETENREVTIRASWGFGQTVQGKCSTSGVQKRGLPNSRQAGSHWAVSPF